MHTDVSMEVCYSVLRLLLRYTLGWNWRISMLSLLFSSEQYLAPSGLLVRELYYIYYAKSVHTYAVNLRVPMAVP